MACALAAVAAAIAGCAASPTPNRTTVEVTAKPSLAPSAMPLPPPGRQGPERDANVVSVGDTTIRYVVGSTEATAAVMKGVRGALSGARACYDAGVHRNGDLRGLVLVRVQLNPRGDIQSVRDAGTALPDPDVVECILHAFRTTSFAELDGHCTGDVQVTQRMDLEPRP
jgi:hypothetical protein